MAEAAASRAGYDLHEEQGSVRPGRYARLYQPNRFLLTDIHIQGQPIDDQILRVSPITTRAGADGTLGLDVLTRFETNQFHVRTLRLTLT